MIIQESKIEQKEISYDGIIKREDYYICGYFLTLSDLAQLVRDFQADCHDGFVSNDSAYIESWLKKHNRIV
jgi:hypothetical protein